MHENREISCASWSKDQDWSAKAINRTADVHAQEKSDCAIVPLNRSNKEVQASAEVGEGRAQTEENIVQSQMSSTQSGKHMSQGLRGVREVATVRKQERFTALLHHITIDLLRDSFLALQRVAAEASNRTVIRHWISDITTPAFSRVLGAGADTTASIRHVQAPDRLEGEQLLETILGSGWAIASKPIISSGRKRNI